MSNLKEIGEGALDWDQVPRYKVHRLKNSQKEHFRWSAHTGGLAILKQRDYEPGGEMESATPYSLWKELQEPGSRTHEQPLCAGDVLEIVGVEGPPRLFVTKYIGFEPAQWFVPDVKAAEPAIEDQIAAEPERAMQN